MKNEAAFWSQYVRPLLHQPKKAFRWAWKIPAELRTGLPDVNYGNRQESGWIELKYAPEWPVRTSSTVHVAVTDEQYAHLREVHECGRPAYCLLGVDDWFFLLGLPVLRPQIKYTRQELQQVAAALGVMRRDDHVLLTALRA
jgi:hypothetical protein